MMKPYYITACSLDKVTFSPEIPHGNIHDLTVTCRRTEDRAPLAEALINYPSIDGRTTPFLHRLLPLEGKTEAREAVLEWILEYMKQRGEMKLYAYMHAGKIEKSFLMKNGFQDLGTGIAVKNLSMDGERV